ncbi:hypothetical protein BGZ98_003650 [Dissophora globulifera]|nr:hypothetical protein BGZ98_003650 [Dissophora globulifera]
MALINWSGPDPFDRIERRMNQVFEHLTDPWWSTRRQRSSSYNQLVTSDVISPVLDVYETDKGWNIHTELPGVHKEDIKIDAMENSVTISAESKFSKDFERENVCYQERRFGTFRRTIPLPDNVDRSKIEAKYNNGVLDLFIPKGEESKPQKINVS